MRHRCSVASDGAAEDFPCLLREIARRTLRVIGAIRDPRAQNVLSRDGNRLLTSRRMSDTDKILAAFTALSDRLAAIEKRLHAVEGRVATIGDAVTQIADDVRSVDRKVTALAREQLPATHRAALGIEELPSNVVKFQPVKEG